VIAFEPDRINYQRIKSLTAHRNNIEIHNLAVSDRTQTLDLFISKTMNVDHQTYPGTEQRESVKVSAFSVDDFFRAESSRDQDRPGENGYPGV
jgi:FkbM family methyltransferase